MRTPRGLREIYRTLGTGGSFGSSTLRQEIGLGDATGIVSVDERSLTAVLEPGADCAVAAEATTIDTAITTALSRFDLIR